ncbi:MAG: ERF family protein [Alphaproteobacteria bacterium]|nr:ERF family protein [Alphaproteobacteria bacterium]
MKEQLLKIQLELKAPKSQYNKFGGFNYRNAEDILEAVKPLCDKYKCCLTLHDEIVQIGDRYYIKATAFIVDIDTKDSIEVYAFAREEESKKGMDGSQITGASSSYARKYALNGLFLIDDTKDSDSTNVGNNKEQIKIIAKQDEEGVDEPALDPRIIEEISEAKTDRELKNIYSGLPEKDQHKYLEKLSNRKAILKANKK